MRYTNPALLDHLASAYVLGTLRGRARSRFERLMRDRADVRLLVGQWQNRVHKLAASVPPAQPSQRVWRNIQQQIKQPAKPESAAQAPAVSGFWSWLKGGALIGGGFAAAMLMVLLQPLSFISVDRIAQQAEKLPQSYVGLLLDDAGAPAVLASSVRQGKTLTLKMLKPVAAPAGTQLVLWALPTEGAPFKVGVIPAGIPVRSSGTIELADTSEKLFAKVPKLMVTAEPVSPAPAAPSTPPLLSGHCVKLW
ncbi:MAG: anti-sigma factor [Burkholderiaceae bacterium]